MSVVRLSTVIAEILPGVEATGTKLVGIPDEFAGDGMQTSRDSGAHSLR